MLHILLSCSLAALTGLFGGFVDAAVAALTDFSWDFVDAEVKQRRPVFRAFLLRLQFGGVDWFFVC